MERRLNPNYTNIDFIDWNSDLLTKKEFNKTICYKILNSEPYCSIPIDSWMLLGKDISYLDKLKSTLELLNFYDEKYSINKYVESSDNILIHVKNYNIF